jgi:hypothetical protein
VRVRWPRGFRCPRCNHDQAFSIEPGGYINARPAAIRLP